MLSELILCGDFNINYLDANSRKLLLDSLLASFSLFGTVKFPTRIFNNSCTLINNIYIHTNRYNFSVHPLINGLSDHDAQVINLSNILSTVPKHLFSFTRRIDRQLPNQWNEGIICPVYKKGDRLDCTNYRPITLLNVAYKIFAIILNQRLVDIAETELGEYQSGFRPNTCTSTVDNIFKIRQIIEKRYEYNVDIHNIFIDYKHAFYSIKRNKILDSLTQNKIPPKLIRLIKLTLENNSKSKSKQCI